MGLIRDVIWPSILENGVIFGINAVVIVLAFVAYGWNLVDLLGLILLLEGTVFMLIGGAMEFATSASGRAFVSFVTGKPNATSVEDYRKAANRASIFALVGVMLFVESLALALAVG